MDHESFDRLVRVLGTPGSRRAALAALLGLGTAATAEVTIARKAKNRGAGRKGRGARNRKQRNGNQTQAEAACFNGSPCIPGPGKNLGKCDFGGPSTTLKNQNLKGANLGQANLARADASGANLAGANLDKACLVDAILTGATINNSTNISTAIRCRTTMPDGSIDNSGCNKGTPCCPTCDAQHPCGAGAVCCDGRCRSGECCDDSDCPGAVCCNRQCCDAGQVCDTRQNPDTCCSPGGTCAPGSCASVPDLCGGQRQCSCEGDLDCCGVVCTNTQTDPDNCGACGNACGECQTCSNGQCGGGCGPCQTCQGDLCVNACAGWQTCQNGACSPTCAERCPAAGCTACYGLFDNSVVCGNFNIHTCDAFVCDAASDCPNPATGDRCVLTSTSVDDNSTEPMCDERPGATCATISPCAA